MRVQIEQATDRLKWMPDIKSCANFSSYDEKIMRHFMFITPLLWRAKIDGELACVWGLVPPSILSDRAYLWLFTTRKAEDHEFLLVRYSQRMIKEMLKSFDTIVGHGLVGNDRGNRWLRWLGAEFGKPQGNKIPFVIRKKDG